MTRTLKVIGECLAMFTEMALVSPLQCVSEILFKSENEYDIKVREYVTCV